MKKLFKRIMTMAIVTGFALSFYGGMYFNASMQSDNPKIVMMNAIQHALGDTSNQPIIIIEPVPSLIEKVMFWKEPIKREEIKISLDVATEILSKEYKHFQNQPGKYHQKAAIWFSKVKNIYATSYNWVGNHTWRKVD